LLLVFLTSSFLIAINQSPDYYSGRIPAKIGRVGLPTELRGHSATIFFGRNESVSERNLKMMVQFYKEYQKVNPIGQRAVAQLDDIEILQPLVAK